MPEYTFHNGDHVIIGFKLFQCLDFNLVHVIDFYDVPGVDYKTFYIEPGEIFTYEILSREYEDIIAGVGL